MTVKTIPERSSETQLLVMRFRKLVHEELITYHDMSVAIGRNVQKEGRGNLTTAMRAAEREEGIILATVYKIGVKRLTPDAIPTVGFHGLKRMRNIARRARKRMEHAAANEVMSDEAKRQVFACTSTMRVTEELNKPRSIKKLESRFASMDLVTLPIAKTLEFFGINTGDS